MLKLKKLKILGYKNIKEQLFDFSANQGLIALVGENGSGKSNLLEALSHIFNSILQGLSVDFGYTLIYSHNENEIKLSKNDNTLEITVNAYPISVEKFIEQHIPSRIIANYSGEDVRMFRKCYKPSYDKFIRQLINQDTLPSLPMLYIDKHYWNLCLLALYIPDPTVRTDIADFCTTQLGVNTLHNITFEVDLGIAKNWKDNESSQLLQIIFSVDNLHKLEELNNSNDKGIVIVKEKQKKVSARVTLSLDELKKRVWEANIDEKQFFLYLYAAFTSKDHRLLTAIKINLELTNAVVIGVEELSEGEKKLILIEFITKIIGDENSIVLLDEPDAHTHISRKKQLLRAVNSFDGQVILTTHSPIFVNEIHKTISNSLYFIKEGKLENGELIKKLVDLSGGLLDYIQGSVIFASKNILALEGLSDIKCIRKAIEVFSIRETKYMKLRDVQLISFGGTGNASELFTEVLFYHMEHIDHLIYLFDNDGEGKKGYEKIKRLIEGEEARYRKYRAKIKPIFYKEGSSNFELEDCFSQEAYRDIIRNNQERDTYRKFKEGTRIVNDIKDRIKNDVDTFQPEWFDGFEPVLNKLLQVFDLI